MDFIERWFQFSPDGGNGMLEVTYVLCLVGAAGLILLRKRLRGICSHLRSRHIWMTADSPAVGRFDRSARPGSGLSWKTD
jgi:hypothetical protein